VYDNLDRLDMVYYGLSTLLDLEYDPLKGGITKKSDVGRMNYNTSGKPYAVSDVYESTGLIPAVLDSLTYTSFESVNSVWEEPYSASFVYNSDNERAKMEVKENSNVILTRWYASTGYIKETAGGVTKEYTFIGGDAYTAPLVAIKQNGGNPAWYYLLRDHLGSITHVVDASTNTTLYEYSFDAWGRMRDPATWNPYAPSQIALSNPFVAGSGYTGHEHLPWFSMINMNGRLYDPLVGQFLSPDNNVQFPDFTQNLNRYGYCLNNPLKYNDPDGEWFITALAMLANMYVSTSAANGWQFNPAKWDWGSPKTWVSLLQSGISGYAIGSGIENYIKDTYKNLSHDFMESESGGESFGKNAEFLNDKIPPGNSPTVTGEIAPTSVNKNYGKFGMTRDGGLNPHFGKDFKGNLADDVFGSYSGEVSKIGLGPDLGPYAVRIKSEINGLNYFVDYGYLAANHVNVGDYINAGDIIGYMGREGIRNGYPTHVHVAIWRYLLNGIRGFVRHA